MQKTHTAAKTIFAIKNFKVFKKFQTVKKNKDMKSGAYHNTMFLKTKSNFSKPNSQMGYQTTQ